MKPMPKVIESRSVVIFHFVYAVLKIMLLKCGKMRQGVKKEISQNVPTSKICQIVHKYQI